LFAKTALPLIGRLILYVKLASTLLFVKYAKTTLQKALPIPLSWELSMPVRFHVLPLGTHAENMGYSVHSKLRKT
jgi:hypothetical protein